MTHHPPDAEEQRAREWCLAHGLTLGVEEDLGYDVPHEGMVASLALLLKRVAIEAKEKEAFECMALFRGERDINNVYILIHDRARRSRAQLTALNEDKQDNPR